MISSAVDLALSINALHLLLFKKSTSTHKETLEYPFGFGLSLPFGGDLLTHTVIAIICCVICVSG